MDKLNYNMRQSITIKVEYFKYFIVMYLLIECIY